MSTETSNKQTQPFTVRTTWQSAATHESKPARSYRAAQIAITKYLRST